MNTNGFKTSYGLILCLLIFCSLTTVAHTQPTKITPREMTEIFTNTAHVVNGLHKGECSHVEQAIEKYEGEQAELGKLKDDNKIGVAEFEQRRKTIEGKINRLQQQFTTLEKRDASINDNVQNILMSGWNTALKVHEEEHQRKTAIARTAVDSAIKNEGRLEQLKYMTDPTTLVRSGAFLSLTTMAMYGGYLGLKFAYAQLDIPPLEKESFTKGIKESIVEFFLGKEEKDLSFFNDTIFPEKVNDQLLKYAEQTRNSHDRGLPKRHLLLYGKPGTGKTMFARKFARYVDMDFEEIPGGNWAMREPSQRIAALKQLFDRAQKSKNGLIIYIDEGETLLGKKNNLDPDNSQFINTFLAYTGTSTSTDKQALAHNCLIIISTNHPKNIAEEILSRFPKQVHIPLPGIEERKKMVNHYFDLYIKNDARTNKRTNEELHLTITDDITPEFLEQTAQSMDAWSGREIDQMFDELRAQAYGSDNLLVNKALFNLVFEEKMAQHKAIEQLTSPTITSP